MLNPEYARYRGYWLRFHNDGIDVLGHRKRLLGSFVSASRARLFVKRQVREARNA